MEDDATKKGRSEGRRWWSILDGGSGGKGATGGTRRPSFVGKKYESRGLLRVRIRCHSSFSFSFSSSFFTSSCLFSRGGASDTHEGLSRSVSGWASGSTPGSCSCASSTRRTSLGGSSNTRVTAMHGGEASRDTTIGEGSGEIALDPSRWKSGGGDGGAAEEACGTACVTVGAELPSEAGRLSFPSFPSSFGGGEEEEWCSLCGSSSSLFSCAASSFFSSPIRLFPR